jgi:hypothetical protein
MTVTMTDETCEVPTSDQFTTDDAFDELTVVSTIATSDTLGQISSTNTDQTTTETETENEPVKSPILIIAEQPALVAAEIPDSTDKESDLIISEQENSMIENLEEISQKIVEEKKVEEDKIAEETVEVKNISANETLEVEETNFTDSVLSEIENRISTSEKEESIVQGKNNV